MELTGRITQDAKVNDLKESRKVVRFSIAINDSYKPKGTDEWKKITTYVNCSYWMREGIAKYLTKGTLVEVQGRISVSAWKNADGEAKGSLDFHVNTIKLHGKTNSGKMQAERWLPVKSLKTSHSEAGCLPLRPVSTGWTFST